LSAKPATPSLGGATVNLRKHEFIGLGVSVVRATDPSLVGVKGRVVDESRNMLIIESGGREKSVPKTGSRFWFEVEGGVEIDGSEILYRPEDRIKKAR